MKIRYYNIILLVWIIGFSFISCSKEKESVTPQLSVSTTTIAIPEEGGTAEIDVESNSDWKISNSPSWLQLNQTTGKSGSAKIKVTATGNATGATRSSSLDISASNGQTRKVTVSQVSQLYPSYNTSPKPADATGMSSNAVELAAKMKLGWNIGNTMEAIGGETAWGNPQITEAYVKAVKQAGFNTIRLPCAWDQYLANSQTAQIKTEWLNRVKQVVQYAVDNDMYIIVNIHWDGGWLENNITVAKQAQNNAKQKAFWEQIATHLRDFDEHLLFASANEPNVHNATEMEVLLSYHQTFVNAVRSTGGRNSNRVLIVQGPATDIESTNSLMNKMPTDPVSNRLMVEVHYYTPSPFCILYEDASWSPAWFYWGEGNYSTLEPSRNSTSGKEPDVLRLFGLMKTKFVDKGIPVILGEYGTIRRLTGPLVPLELEKHQKSVDDWLTYITKQAIAHGLKPFFWDTGGALDRRTLTVKDQRTIDALLKGGQ